MADNNDLRIAISSGSTGAFAPQPKTPVLSLSFVKEVLVPAYNKREKIARSLVANPDGSVQSGEEFLTEMRNRRDG